MVSIYQNGKGYKLMSEGDQKTDNESVDEIKKSNIKREENIKKETDKIKKVVDLILKNPSHETEKKSVEKKTDKKNDSTKKKMTEKK
tara:strand:- start:39 stop:299 length:261 start_codon:yes stop_codon:yes gene_type:complete